MSLPDVILVLMNTIRTPPVDVPERRVDEDGIRIGSELFLVMVQKVAQGMAEDAAKKHTKGVFRSTPLRRMTQSYEVMKLNEN